MLGLVQIAVGAVVMSLGSPLFAAEIRWLGEDSCRRELEVKDQVEAMTARPVSTVEIADFELNVKALSRDQWLLELTTARRADGARSTRAINGLTCAEVSDAAAVAIALAIGPTEPAPERKIESKTASKPRVSAPPKEPAQPAEKPPATQNSHDWFAGVGAALDSSATPSVAFGAALRFGVSWLPSDTSQTRIRFELEGALYAPTETSNVGGQAGKFQLLYAAPMVCGAKPLVAATLLGCVGYELGQLSGEGVGDAVTVSHPSNTFWSAGSAELGLLVPLATSLRFVGRAGVAVPMTRREFVLDGPEVVFRPAPVSARLGLGVELSL